MTKTFSFTLALLLAGSVGCSSTENNNTPAADTGSDDTSATTDTGTLDTGSTPDTGNDGAISAACPSDLPAGYACPALTVPAPSTACTEALLQEYAVKCVKDDFTVGAECAAFKTANPACKTCIEAWAWDDNKVYPDDYFCFEKLVPGCGKSLNCSLDCSDQACAECEDDSSYNECAVNANKTGGKCYELAAKNVETCTKDPKGAACNATQYYSSSTDLAKLKTEVVRILRGACRDNGDWTNSESATTGDAGTDSGTTDDAGSDAGTTSDAAAD